MKRLLIILILTFSFQSGTKADDIRDFEIEGISIGDSLLDYFSEDQIKKSKRYDNKNTGWKSDKMFQLRTGKKGPYTEIMFALKKNDKKYIIYGIAGLVKMENNISECYPKLNDVEKEFKELFSDFKIKKGSVKHRDDKSKKSKVTYVAFNFPSGDSAKLECYDWSKKMGYWDNFRVRVDSNVFKKWLSNAYN